MSSDPAYLVTKLTTTMTPPEVLEVLEEHHCRTGADAIAVLTQWLDLHGGCDGLAVTKMQREVDAAREVVGSWPGGHHMKLCGFLLRYDVDPVPAGQLGCPTWQEMRQAESNYIHEQLRVQVPSLRAANPVYVLAGAWIAAAPYSDDDPFLINPRAQLLGQCWELGHDLVVNGMNLRTADTLETWALAFAQQVTEDGEPFAAVSARLRAAVMGSGSREPC